jgi:hypothetical protein
LRHAQFGERIQLTQLAFGECTMLAARQIARQIEFAESKLRYAADAKTATLEQSPDCGTAM